MRRPNNEEMQLALLSPVSAFETFHEDSGEHLVIQWETRNGQSYRLAISHTALPDLQRLIGDAIRVLAQRRGG